MFEQKNMRLLLLFLSVCFSSIAQNFPYNNPEILIGKKLNLKEENNHNFFTRFDLVKNQINHKSFKKVYPDEYTVLQYHLVNDSYGEPILFEYVLELKHSKKSNLFYHYKAYDAEGFEMEIIDDIPHQYKVDLKAIDDYQIVNNKMIYSQIIDFTYQEAKDWMIKYYNNPQLKILADSPNKLIKFNYRIPVMYREMGIEKEGGIINYTLLFEFEDGKCKYTFSDLMHSGNEYEEIISLPSYGECGGMLKITDKVNKKVTDQLLQILDIRVKSLIYTMIHF